jgi:uncharacterized membrane protein YjfL (UPF0719 family)
MDIFSDPSFQLDVIAATIFYAVVGIVLMVVSIIVFDKMFKLDLRKELVEEHNTAFGILFAGVAVAMSIIVAASILG